MEPIFRWHTIPLTHHMDATRYLLLSPALSDLLTGLFNLKSLTNLTSFPLSVPSYIPRSSGLHPSARQPSQLSY